MERKILAFLFCLAGLFLTENFAFAEEEKMFWPNGEMTLQEAYEKTSNNGILTIKKGKHHVGKTLVVRKNISIVGESLNRDDVLLYGEKESILRIESGFAKVQNLTFQNEGEKIEAAEEERMSMRAASIEDQLKEHERQWERRYARSAVLLQSPSSAFENCVFISENGIGFTVNKKNSAPIVVNCAAKGYVGFCAAGGAKGEFMDCEIGDSLKPVNNSNMSEYVMAIVQSQNDNLAGILVRDIGTNPTVVNCQFNKLMSGIAIDFSADLGGTFIDCQANGNFQGIHTYGNGTFIGCEARGCMVAMFIQSVFEEEIAREMPESKLMVKKCRFTDSELGIQIFNCSGTFTECEISRNKQFGIILRGGNPTVENCDISMNGTGVQVGGENGNSAPGSAAGTFRNNRLSQNRVNWNVTTGAPIRIGNTPNR